MEHNHFDISWQNPMLFVSALGPGHLLYWSFGSERLQLTPTAFILRVAPDWWKRAEQSSLKEVSVEQETNCCVWRVSWLTQDGAPKKSLSLNAKVVASKYKGIWFLSKTRISNCRNDTWTKYKKKLRGLSPRANYTDRATAACRRS
jgi:hypothetical protein